MRADIHTGAQVSAAPQVVPKQTMLVFMKKRWKQVLFFPMDLACHTHDTFNDISSLIL